ncbi:MAG: hypothetical protein NTW19_14025 [Planctomycetota bacterium]|nr:hypothetical protein [Planctomycetota bacterium]
MSRWMHAAALFAAIVGLTQWVGCASSPPSSPSAGAAQTAPGVPAIVDVASLADLRKTEPLRLSEDWTVRVGLAGSGEEGGPWSLLYCLATWTGKGKDKQPFDFVADGRGVLGPICFSVTDGRDGRAGPKGLEHARRLDEETPFGPQLSRGADRLYAAPVAMAWPGRYFVRITTRDGRPLLERELSFKQPRECNWQTFAHDGDPDHYFTTGGDHLAAYPAMSGRWPLAWLDGDTVMVGNNLISTCQRSPRSLPATLPLTGDWDDLASGARFMVPHTSMNQEAQRLTELSADGARYPLTLELHDDVLAIGSPQPVLFWADYLMLARWWVNGVAVVPKRGSGGFSIMLGRMVSYDSEAKVALRLPAGLGPLKVGDRVGLQVLYCPDGYHMLPAERGQHFDAEPNFGPEPLGIPLESNRIEFKVTKAMLDGAAAPVH